MKYYLILPIVILALAAISVSCNKDEEPVPETEQPQKTEEDDTSGGNPPDGNNTPNEPGNNDVPDDPDNNDESEQNPMSNKLTIRIGAVSFSAILEDNAAAKAFKAMLPLIIVIQIRPSHFPNQVQKLIQRDFPPGLFAYNYTRSGKCHKKALCTMNHKASNPLSGSYRGWKQP